MSKEIATQQHSIIELDGLSGSYLDDSGQGDDDRMSSRVIQGRKIKFNDPHWYLDGQVITGRSLTIIAMRKIVNKWTADGTPPETQILLPSDPFPDFKALNKACPENEWFEKFGEWVGPYQGQRAFYFIDADYNRYTWASPVDTIGSTICFRETMHQIELVRRHRGADAYPVSELGHTDFKTKVGLKQRPYLLKIQWVRLNPSRIDPLPAADAAPVAEIASQDSSATTANGTPADAQPVTTPTAKEVTGDEIRY